ncbi:MAG: trimethylamine methyltransferase family protein [Desulfobacterales bacterium]|nr:trimethylamine methyltransferase family protein [Desulfobacterales bacterium]
MNFNTRMRYYTEIELELMKDRVYELLEKRGARVDHNEILDRFHKAGGIVDFDTRIVKFPRAFIKEQVAKAPKTFTLAGREGKHAIEFPHPRGLFHTRTCTGGQNWLDPETGEFHRVKQENLVYWARLADRLEHIDYVPFLVLDDVPTPTADIYALRTMLENTEKHIWIQPYVGESVEYLIRLLKAAAGGKEALRKNPLASFVTCSLSPFDFKWMDMEIISQAASHGCALQMCSLPGSGATGPITAPGSVMLAAAENLVMLAASQVVAPGTPVIATSLQFSADMRTGRSLQSSVESLRQSALFVQLMYDGFGIPGHTYGTGSDSPDIDSQGMVERAMRAVMMAGSGAQVLGGAGQLETACSVSPVALAIDNEMFGMTKAILSKMTFDDDQMAFDELMDIEPGGQFLTTPHTFKHCREVAEPVNFTRSPRDSWAAGGSLGLNERIKLYLRELMADAGPVALPGEIRREMDGIVADADRNLG